MNTEQQIEEMARKNCHIEYHMRNYKTCKECYEANYRACRVYEVCRNHYNEGYRKQEWISVEDRLPDTDGKYLVARREGNNYSISVRKFRKEIPCWYTGYCGHWERRTNAITHWMPLPKSPKLKGE